MARNDNKMSDEIEDIDSENDEEIIEETQEETPIEIETHEVSAEDTTDWEAEAKKQQAINARLVKKLNKPQVAPQVEKQTSTNQDINSSAVDEKILRSTKGYDDETIDKLTVVAKGLGVDLFKAEKDQLFQDYLARKQADERKEKAKLGSSKGSQVSQETQIGSLSRDEHQEVFKEIMSKVN